jgi:hypothetical protein
VDTVIVIDEYQEIVSQALAKTLAGDRKHRISYILANQDLAQLSAVDPYLAATILNQIKIQLFFTPDTEDEQKYVRQFSKLVRTTSKSVTKSPTGIIVTEREIEDRKLQVNQLIEVAQAPSLAVLVNRAIEGYREPAIVHLEYLMGEDVYHHLKSLFFPARPVPAPAPVAPPTLPKPAPGWRNAPKDETYREREALLGSMATRIETWLSGVE